MHCKFPAISDQLATSKGCSRKEDMPPLLPASNEREKYVAVLWKNEPPSHVRQIGQIKLKEDSSSLQPRRLFP